MLLRIMLWAMLIGSIVMGYFGIQSGSATNTAAGIGILLVVGFALYFLIKMLLQFGFWAIKGILVILLIAAIIIIGVRGCQFLFAKGKAVSQAAIEKTADLDDKIKEESVWDKVLSFFDKRNQGNTVASGNGADGTVSGMAVSGALPEVISGRVTNVRSGYLFKIGSHFIKLYGIDAPDPAQVCRDRRDQEYDCGHEAKRRLERLILGKTLDCQVAGGDYRENYIATCTIQGVDVGVGMVSVGWAVADRAVSTVYIPYENEARSKHLGLWAGKFVAPWQARATRVRRKAQPAAEKKGFFDGWF